MKSEPREVSAPIPVSQPPVGGHVPLEMTNALATSEEDSVTYQEYYEEYGQYAAEGDMQGYDGALVGLSGGQGERAIKFWASPGWIGGSLIQGQI